MQLLLPDSGSEKVRLTDGISRFLLLAAKLWLIWVK